MSQEKTTDEKYDELVRKAYHNADSLQELQELLNT